MIEEEYLDGMESRMTGCAEKCFFNEVSEGAVKEFVEVISSAVDDSLVDHTLASRVNKLILNVVHRTVSTVEGSVSRNAPFSCRLC